jgi:uncharacterized protein
MRSISLAVFCTLVLSCASATVSSNQEAENIRVVQTAYQNFGSGNMDALVNSFSPDVEWRMARMENVPFARTRRGREEVRDFFTNLGQAQEVLSFEPREYIAQGDRVVVLGHYSWRVRSTGRPFESDWAMVFTVRNGQIVAFQEFTDTAAVAAAYRP